MLPDLPRLKKRIRERFSLVMHQRKLQHAPLMAQIKSYFHHEGDRYSYETHEGQIEEKTLKVFRTPVTIPIKPSPEEQGAIVEAKLDEAAKSIAKQHTQLLFTTASEITERTGNIFSAGGRPFHMSMYLDALEKMPIDFDDKGQPRLPTIVMHPNQMKHVERHIAEWETDRALIIRWSEVIARKREEWRDREADRKLVG